MPGVYFIPSHPFTPGCLMGSRPKGRFFFASPVKQKPHKRLTLTKDLFFFIIMT